MGVCRGRERHDWGSGRLGGPWGGGASEAATASGRVVAAATHRTADGQPVAMEAFCIAVAKRRHLPGFGDRALTDPQGNTFPLNRAEAFYRRLSANIAFMCKTTVALSNSVYISLTRVIPC